MLFFLSKWQCQKPYWKESTVLSLEKKNYSFGSFLTIFFPFSFFLYIHLAVVLFFYAHIFLGKGMVFFFQKGDYLFFVYFVMFSKGIIIRLFLKYNNQKIMEREEERSKWKNEVWNCVEKSVLWAWNWFIPSKNLWFWVSAPWSSDFIIKTF